MRRYSGEGTGYEFSRCLFVCSAFFINFANMFTCGKSLLQIVIWQLRMKKILIIGMAVMMSMAFSSCKKEKKSTDIITTKPVVKVPKKTQQMSNYVQMREVSWLGAMKPYILLTPSPLTTSQTVKEAMLTARNCTQRM